MTSTEGAMQEGTSVLEGYLTPEQLGKDLKKTTRTLARWEAQRIGPPITRIGKQVYYRRESVVAWLAEQENRRSNGKGRRRQ
jgi:hypothetical protein